MSPKEYAMRIENPDHGLLIHFLFTLDEFKNTKLWLGTVEMQTKEGKKEVNYIDAKYTTLMDLLNSCKEIE